MIGLRSSFIWQIILVGLFVLGLLLDEPIVAAMLPVLVFLAFAYVIVRFMMAPIGDLFRDDALFPPAVLIAAAGAVAMFIAPPDWLGQVPQRVEDFIGEHSAEIGTKIEPETADVQSSIPEPAPPDEPLVLEPTVVESPPVEAAEAAVEIETLTAEKASIEAALEEARAAKQSAEAETTAVRGELSEAKSARLEAERQLALERSAAAESNGEATSEREVALLRDRLEVAELSLAAAQEEAAAADRLRADVKRLEQSLQTAMTASAEGASALAIAEAEVEAQLVAKDELLAVAARKNGALTEKLASAEAALSEKAESVSGQDQALSAKQDEFDQLARAHEEAKAALAQAEADLESSRRMGQALQASVEDLKTDVREGRNRLGLIYTERKGLFDRLAASREEKAELTDRIAAQEAEAERFRKRSEALQAEVKRIASVLSATDRLARERQAQGVIRQAAFTDEADPTTELSQFRSALFQRLESELGASSDMAVIGDRLVLPAERLFDPDSADLGLEGTELLERLATVLNDVATGLPPEVDWMLSIDGHTNEVSQETGAFASNRHLASARALAVTDLLTAHGIPPRRLSANALGAHRPLDDESTSDAPRRNSRIELTLTNR